MKNVLYIILVVFSSGCGVSNNFCEHNKEGAEEMCHDVFGYDYYRDDYAKAGLEAKQKQIDELKEHLRALIVATSQSMYDIDAIENQMISVQLRLLELEQSEPLLSIVDPCGDNSTKIDEVGFQMQNGSFIFYFEESGNRRLSVLQKNVTYQTTDGTLCRFYINNNNQLINL